VTGRTIVRVDGLFEAALGIVLLAGALAGALDAGDFPAPVGARLIGVVGIALLGVALVLWLLARRAVAPRLLRALAAANLTTAAATALWLLAASGFSGAGAALTLLTAACLAALGAAQLAIAARRGSPRAFAAG
jgi:hypothetical protein